MLPVVRNLERLKKILSGVLVYVFAGRLFEDVREKLRDAAAVDENLSGLSGYGLVNDVLHPVVVGLHYIARILGIVVGQIFVPLKARGHGQQVTHGDALLAFVYIRNPILIEIFQNRRIEIYGEFLSAHGDPDSDRSDRLRDGLHGVHSGVAVIRMKLCAEIIVWAV